MYEKILVTLDGSRLAETIVPYVAQLAAALGSQVTVLHVATAEPPSSTKDYSTPSHEYLEGIAAKVLQAGVLKADRHMAAGEAHKEIVSFAEGNGYNLIAMATHGRSGLGRWAFGSTADKVLQTSTLPLLLRRPPEGATAAGSKPVSSLVVPLDGSTVAEGALPVVQEVARRMKVPVTLLRVVPIIGNLAAGPEPYAFDPRVDAEMEAAAEKYLSQVREGFQRMGLEATTKLKRGYPPNQILEHAETVPGALIVMTTHGRSGVSRWVLGSVADRVLRTGQAPVLLLRAKG